MVKLLFKDRVKKAVVQQVRFIWPARTSLGKALYAVIRYLPGLEATLAIYCGLNSLTKSES